LENTQLFWMIAMHHVLFRIAWRQATADAELEGFVPPDVFTVDVNDIGEGFVNIGGLRWVSGNYPKKHGLTVEMFSATWDSCDMLLYVVMVNYMLRSTCTQLDIVLVKFRIPNSLSRRAAVCELHLRGVNALPCHFTSYPWHAGWSVLEHGSDGS